MNIKPIKTEQDYQEALRIVEPMFDNEPVLGSPESDLFEVMCLLIENYESKHYPIAPPDPIEAIMLAESTGNDRKPVTAVAVLQIAKNSCSAAIGEAAIPAGN